jgi:hypothetical protein
MIQQYRFLAGNFPIQMLILACLAVASSDCSRENREPASRVSLEKLSSSGQWMLVHIARNDNSWPIWWEAWVEQSDVYWIKVFDHAPTNQGIDLFLNANKWWSAYERFDLLDGEVCSNAWKKVTGQEPNKTFEKLDIF